MIKVAILTQPLHNNYGGLLQAFALQEYLRRNGFVVKTVDIQFDSPNLQKVLRGFLSSIYRKFLKGEDVKYFFPVSKTENERIGKHTKEFREKYIETTNTFFANDSLHELLKENFDAFIVGSDQVWRPIYSPRIETYFLDFLINQKGIKRIAYAASFGTDNFNEFEPAKIDLVKTLAAEFDAISVREDSAVSLCNEYLNIDAEHVVDPTMLLEASDYLELVASAAPPDTRGTLMTYVLDKSKEKQDVICKISKMKNLVPFTVMQRTDKVFPPVESWIKGFHDADFVVTDSFHGVVFSIIFNKQFLAIGNASRGLARFESLLRMFGLEDRLISDIAQIDNALVNKKIDFSRVNRKRKELQLSASSFLLNALR